MKLVIKLLLLFFLFALLPIGGAGYVVYRNALENKRELVANELNTINNLKEAELRRWFAEKTNALEILAEQTQVQEYALTLMTHTPGDLAYDQSAQHLLEEHLKPTLKLCDGFMSISILNPNNATVLLSTDSSLIGKSYQRSEHFLIEGRKGSYISAPVYDDVHQEVTLHISAPVSDPNGDLAVILVGVLDLEKIGEIIREQASPYESEDSYLVDANKNFLIISRLDKAEQYFEREIETQAILDCLDENSGWGTYLNYRGMSVVGNYDWLDDLSICLVTEVDEQEALEVVNMHSNQYLRYLSIALLGIFILALILALIISQPLEKLLTGTQLIAAGDLDHQIEIHRGDEIGELAQSINQMTSNLKKHFGESAYKSRLLQALGDTAIQIQHTHKEDELYRIIGEELFQFGYDTLFFRLDRELCELTIPYMRMAERKQRLAEVLTGLTPDSFRLKLEDDSIFYQISERESAQLFSTQHKVIEAALAPNLQKLISQLIRLAASNPIILAPLFIDHQAYGFVNISGPGLSQSDVAAVNTFAQQISSALKNIQLIKELRKNEEHFRLLIEKSSDIICLLDENGDFQYVSPSVENILGYQATELIGKDSKQYVHPEDRHIAERIITDISKSSREMEYQDELRALHKDGRWRILEVNSRMIFDRQGKKVILITQHDITDRVAAEKEIIAHKDLLEKIFESADLAIFLLDVEPGPQFRYITINPKDEQITGVPAEQVVGKTVFELVPDILSEQDAADRQANLERCLTLGQSISLEEKLTVAGKDIWWLTRLTPLFDENEEITRILGTSLDITNRKRAEQTIQEQRNFLDSIYRGVEIGVFILDIDEHGATHFIGMNPMMEEALGIPTETIVGHSLEEIAANILSSDSARLFWQETERCLKSKETIKFENQSLEVINGEEIGWMTRLAPLSNEDGQIYRIIGTTVNITDIKLAERELRQQRDFKESIFEGIDTGIFIIDRDANGEPRYSAMNPAMERLTGIAKEAIIGLSPLEMAPDLIDSETAMRFHTRIMKCFKTGERLVYDDEISFNGMTICWWTQMTPLIDENGQVYRVIASSMDVTQRRQDERELRQYRDFQESIFAGISMGIFVTDIDEQGEFRYAILNPAMEEATGLKSETVIGKTVMELVPERLDAKTAIQFTANIQRCYQSGRTISFEDQSSYGGEPVFWLTRMTPLFNEQGEIYRIVGTALDITERKQMEQEIKQARDELEQRVAERTRELLDSEERFSLLFKHHHAMMMLVEPISGKIVDANPAAAEFYGYTIEELSHMTIFDFNKVGTDEIVLIQQMIKDEEVNSYEIAHFRSSGEERIVEVHASQILFQEQVLYFLIIHDITDRKYTEQALQESEARFRQAVQVSPFPIMIFAEDGEVIMVNQSWVELSGYVRAEISTIHDWTRLAYGDTEFAWQLENNTYQLLEIGMEHTSGEFEITTKYGEKRIWDFSNATLGTMLDGRVMVISIADDITDRVLNERKIAQFTGELERSNKDLKQFAYIVSHDLQEPLRMVHSYLQLLERNYSDQLDQDAHEFINFAVDGAKHMHNLINGLLDYSRIGTHGKPMIKTDMNVVLDKTLHILDQRIKETNTQITRDRLPEVIGDHIQLTQLFQNLISNAIKFCDKETPQVNISLKQDGDEWQFCVCDNGMGFDPSFQDRIFVIFQRLHTQEEYPGAGIGLAVCKRIVERHGGRIWVESQPGEGSQFYFTLPTYRVAEYESES